MTEQPHVRFARRFVATIPDQPDIHGVQFPDSGHCIADVPSVGLTGYLSADDVIHGIDGAALHWADEETAK